MDASVHTYRFRQDAVAKRFRRNMLRSMLIFGVLAATGITILSIAMTLRGENPLFPIIVILISSALVTIQLLRRKPNPELQAVINGYVLSLHDFSITRVYPGMPTVSIPLKSIGSIRRFPNGTLLITSSDSDDKISVSMDLENYEDLVQRLAAIAEIEAQTRWPLLDFLPLAGVLGGFVSFGLMLATTNPVAVGILGGLVVIGGAYSFYTLRYSQQFPASMRKTSWFTLGMIGLALYYMFLVFTGQV